MRRVKLPDLLIEVDNQLGFTRNFLTPAQREEPSPEDICAVLAAVMAHGCNLGVYTMAQLTSNVTYEQLKRIGDWHLTEEAQRSALAELVSAITDLDTSARWGQGKSAASDGQRFSLVSRARATAESQLKSAYSRLRSRLRGCKNLLPPWGCSSRTNSYLVRGCRPGTRH